MESTTVGSLWLGDHVNENELEFLYGKIKKIVSVISYGIHGNPQDLKSLPDTAAMPDVIRSSKQSFRTFTWIRFGLCSVRWQVFVYLGDIRGPLVLYLLTHHINFIKVYDNEKIYLMLSAYFKCYSTFRWLNHSVNIDAKPLQRQPVTAILASPSP